MAKRPGFTEYVDDRDPSIKDVLIEGAKRSSDWFEDARIDVNGVVCTYLFSKENHESYKQLVKKQDGEFNAWLKGGKK